MKTIEVQIEHKTQRYNRKTQNISYIKTCLRYIPTSSIPQWGLPLNVNIEWIAMLINVDLMIDKWETLKIQNYYVHILKYF